MVWSVGTGFLFYCALHQKRGGDLLFPLGVITVIFSWLDISRGRRNLLNCSLQPQNPLIFGEYQQSTLPGCCRTVPDLLWKFYRLTKESEKWSMINAAVFISFSLYLLHHQYSGLFGLLVKSLRIFMAAVLI